MAGQLLNTGFETKKCREALLSLVAICTEERSILDCLHNFLVVAASNPLNVPAERGGWLHTMNNVMMGSNIGTGNTMPPLRATATADTATTTMFDSIDIDGDLTLPEPLDELVLPDFEQDGPADGMYWMACSTSLHAA